MGCLSLALWLPCPLASSWVWPENTGRKSEGGRSAPHFPSSLPCPGCGGQPLFHSTAVTACGTQLPPLAPSGLGVGWLSLWALPCLVDSLHPAHIPVHGLFSIPFC